MNLDDLRSELRTRAADVDTPAHGRMAGIRAKAAARRRRKAGATVAASVLAVGAVIGVPVVSQLSDGPDPADDRGVVFPETIDGDTKIASELGDEGATRVTLEFTPEDTDFLLHTECDDLAPKGRTTGEASLVDLQLNGQSVVNSCGTFGANPQGVAGAVGTIETRDQVRRHWEGWGVKAGEPVELTMEVVRQPDLEPVQEPIEERIGVGVYDMTGERVQTSGVALSTERTIDGETYELAEDGYDVASRGDGSATIEVPELDEPAYVVHGTTGTAKVLRNDATVDGESDVLTSGMSFGYVEPLPDAEAHTVRVVNDKPQSSANVAVAYYTKAEPDDEDAGAFPDTVNGDTRIAYELDADGDNEITLEFTPDDTGFLLDFECEDDEQGYADPVARVNGKRVWSGCELRAFKDATAVYPYQLGSVTPRDQVAERWSGKYGIQPGDRVTVTLKVDDPGGDAASGSRIGVAAYAMTGDRVESSGVALPKETTVGGHMYRLAEDGYDVATGGEVRASVEIPALEAPGVVSYGSKESIWGTLRRATIDGQVPFFSGRAGVWTETTSAGSPHVVTVDKPANREAATVFAAYYTLVSD